MQAYSMAKSVGAEAPLVNTVASWMRLIVSPSVLATLLKLVELISATRFTVLEFKVGHSKWLIQ
jgi:hypothetical protein